MTDVNPVSADDDGRTIEHVWLKGRARFTWLERVGPAPAREPDIGERFQQEMDEVRADFKAWRKARREQDI